MWARVLVALAALGALGARAGPLCGSRRLPGLSLTPYVRHWEPAHYEPAGVRGAERGVRRDRRRAPPQYPASPLRFSFKAHNREFNLRLRPDPSSVFAEDAEFHGTGGNLDYDPGQVYSGTLEDDESSYVYGVVTAGGLFDGTITTPSEEYYVEPLHRYGVSSPQLHSIIYKESDVFQPPRNTSHLCASHLLHMKQKHGHRESIFNYKHQNQGLNYIQNVDRDLNRKRRWLQEEDEGMQEDEPPRKNPELPLDLDVPYTRNGDLDKTSTRKPKTQIDKSNLIIKIRDFDDADSNSRPKPKTHVENHVIKTKDGVVTVRKDIVRKEPVKGFTVISSMNNLTDDGRHVNKRATVDPRKTTCMVYLQADHMFYQRYGSEEACIEVMTRHVQKVNAIYKVTDFNQDGKPDNITFMIKRIKVHTLDALKDPSYRFPSNYGVEKYLELFSEEDYDAFCLAYMFTYRDFEMGTLGLAWTGDLKNAGGVCEKNGHYRGSMKSLNTGIVTLLNYGKHVPPAVSHVTLAHEIGHNFGSPHDPEVCTPGGEDGNYIMFARATSGDKKNNNKFSPCSLRSIDPVLNNKARSAKGCFTEPQPAICGNGVVEEGEECDCGWAAECTDACCRPQAVRPLYKPCTLTENSVCSPSQGPCCTSKCTLKFGDKCREDNGCRDASYCDGKRAQCPSSRHKPNRTRCDKEFVCYMGECTGSICLAYGLESCQCSPRPEQGARAACELCCRAPGGPCRSSFQWNSPPYDVPDMYAKAGTPCNDYNGYCDVFQKCREVDPSGPLATLRKLLLSDESIASFKKWLLDHWYAVLLILLAVIALLVASTRWLGRRSDAKLQSVTIIHSSTTETVRLPSDPNQQGLIVHTAVRSKLPLKKKVALRTRAYRNKKDSKGKPGDKVSPTHASSGLKKRKTKSTKPEEQRPKITKENTVVVTTGEGKSPKHIILSKHKGKGKKRKGKVKKETIDYSSIQKDATLPTTTDSEALNKVQKWLLSSPQPTVIPKSKSTPIGLSDRSHRPTQKAQTRKTRTSKSASNLQASEKARLQVVYKPPFRFSVKICKSDKTKVVLDKSRPEADKRRSENLDVVRTNSSKTPKVSKASNEDNATATNENPLVVKNNTETSYANVLPRSASDCKVVKNLPDVKIRSHKKSSSVGQKRETTESKQNLLAKEELGSGAHLYENLLMSQEPFVPKSCSMPRRQNPTMAIARQSSYSHLPRAQIRQQKNSTNNLSKYSKEDLNIHFYDTIETLKRNISASSVNNHNSNTSSSSGSSRKANESLHKGSSLNNIQGVNRQSGTRNRFSMPSEHYNFGKTSRQNSLVDKDGLTHRLSSNNLRTQLNEDEVPDSRGQKIDHCLPVAPTNLKGFNLVVGKDKLKRQLSENEIHSTAGQRVQLCMPMSAGADPHGGFQWKRSSVDCEVSKLDSKTPKKEEHKLESVQVPNECASTRNKTPAHKKRLRDSGAGAVREFGQTFGELKNTVPDKAAEDLLISPEEFLKMLDT